MHQMEPSMKISLTGTLVAAALLAGCNADDDADQTQAEAVQIPNPASAHCVSLGGQSVIKRDEDGNEYGMCYLPDGTETEEWELFRKDNPQP